MGKIAIALDIGGSKIRAALITKEGKIIKRIEGKTPRKGKTGKVVTKRAIELIKELIRETKKESIKGIGIASTGPIDIEKGKLVFPTNMIFKEVSLVEPIEKEFGFLVSFMNDCTAAAWGEKIFGKGKNYKNLVYITISSGIGGGAIVDNHLLLGKKGNASEIGHFAIDTQYNLSCKCKKGKGHWESYCSGGNMLRFFKKWCLKNKKNLKLKKIEDLFKEAKKGNKIVLNFLKEVGNLNRKGISNTVLAYDPEIIFVGGKTALENKKLILPYLEKEGKISLTSFKENTPLMGSAAIVFYPPK
jgi:glucokinase